MNKSVFAVLIPMVLFCAVEAALAAPIFSVSDVTVGESQGPAEFVISLSEPQTEPVGVGFSTFEVQGSMNTPYPARSGVDFISTDGFVIFAPGETRKSVFVEILDDAINEDNEPFGFGLYNGNSALCYILDDDGFAMWFNDPVVVEGDEGSTYALFTLSTSNDTEVWRGGRDWEFYTRNGSADLSDYRGTGGWFSFGPGPAQTNVFFAAIEVFADRLVEDDETFHLYATGVGEGTCTILNDDFLLTVTNRSALVQDIALHGAIGVAHVLQQSTDLVNWNPFTTNVVQSNGLALVTVTNGGHLFFRAARELPFFPEQVAIHGKQPTRVRLYNSPPSDEEFPRNKVPR